MRLWSVTSRTESLIDETSQSDGISCTYSSNGEFILIGTRNGHIDVFKAPIIVERLVDICRRIVNQLVDHEKIGMLNLPKDLEDFLSYDDIKLSLKSSRAMLPSKFTTKIANQVTCY